MPVGPIARNTLAYVVTVIAAVALTTAMASRLIWGHWFAPPSSDVQDPSGNFEVAPVPGQVNEAGDAIQDQGA